MENEDSSYIICVNFQQEVPINTAETKLIGFGSITDIMENERLLQVNSYTSKSKCICI